MREEIRVSSLFSNPNLLPLLGHAIISVKIHSHSVSYYLTLLDNGYCGRAQSFDQSYKDSECITLKKADTYRSSRQSDAGAELSEKL
ncbi:hypothetical protein CFP56_001939 [Quercus suber]|uniref:Uncharacterized protein n=1 Tax=Quercus suber TaxID=58331 RepID=A0AAW0LEX6_QUESU